MDELPTPPVDRYSTIDFAGAELLTVFRPDEGMGIPVRIVCERLGLDIRTQGEKLRKHAVLSKGLRRDRVPINDRMLEIMVLLHKYLPMWLATIDPNDVAEDMREKLILYQTELVDVLAAIYLERTGLQRSPEQRQLAQLTEEIRQILAVQRNHETRLSVVEELMADVEAHIPVTPAQAEFIRRALRQLGARYQQRTGKDMHAMLMTRFQRELGTQRYDSLPASQYEQAMDWLVERAREYLPDDPDAIPPRQERLL